MFRAPITGVVRVTVGRSTPGLRRSAQRTTPRIGIVQRRSVVSRTASHARSIGLRPAVEQCRAAGVPLFVKQDSGRRLGMRGRIPEDLWLREYPRTRVAVNHDSPIDAHAHV
jgi:hypothetical protein